MQRELVKAPQPILTKRPEWLAPPIADVEYPSSDGKPMAEADEHRDQMTDSLLHPLKERYRDAPQVYISGNLLLYYEEGNPRASVAPDVFVVFGIEKRLRPKYLLWKEGKAPDVTFELTSKSTRKNDPGKKRLLYEKLGVREYFIFDPERDYLKPPLQGFRLVGKAYVPMTPKDLGDDNWELYSEVLGLVLRTDGPTLRLYDPVQGAYLLTRGQEAEARRQAEEQAKLEAEARRQAQEQAAAEAEARRQAENQLLAAQEELTRLRAQLRQRGSKTTPDAL